MVTKSDGRKDSSSDVTDLPDRGTEVRREGRFGRTRGQLCGRIPL